jgi:hypothetical protein
MDGGWAAQMVAIERGEEQKPFVALDDLEQLATTDVIELAEVFRQLRIVFESWKPRTEDVYVQKSTE